MCIRDSLIARPEPVLVAAGQEQRDAAQDVGAGEHVVGLIVGGVVEPLGSGARRRRPQRRSQRRDREHLLRPEQRGDVEAVSYTHLDVNKRPSCNFGFTVFIIPFSINVRKGNPLF